MPVLMPARLAQMKLGCQWRPQAFMPVALTGAGRAPVEAYSRIEGAPRVAGHNDECGDCVETAACNAVQTRLAIAGGRTALSDELPVSIYEQPAVAGYVPGDAATDVGTDPARLFAWWKANSIGGWKLRAETPIAPSMEGDVRNAILGLGVFLVLELSVEMQNQKLWLPAGTPGSWGGHAMWCDEFDGALTWGTTWGQPQAIDRSLFGTPFVLGAYALDLVAA